MQECDSAQRRYIFWEKNPNKVISLVILKMTLGIIQKTLLGGGGFSIFSGKIWLPHSEDWQNLGASLWELAESRCPHPLRNVKIWVPTYLYVYNIFNNNPVCVIWPYLSYFSFLIISIWQNRGAPFKDWQNIYWQGLSIGYYAVTLHILVRDRGGELLNQ